MLNFLAKCNLNMLIVVMLTKKNMQLSGYSFYRKPILKPMKTYIKIILQRGMGSFNRLKKAANTVNVECYIAIYDSLEPIYLFG